MPNLQISISIKDASPQPNPFAIVEVRKYGDDVMVELMGLDTNILGTSNFQNISLCTRSNGFGAVSQFQRLGKAQMDYLVSIQPQDEATLNEKIQFLVNGTKGRPYWTNNGLWNDWQESTTLSFGTIVFGGQKCAVELDEQGQKKEYTLRGKYQNRNYYEDIVFYKLVGMRWADRHKYNATDHPYFLQRGTWATWRTNPPNQYRDTWHEGVVLHPVWSPLDFPTNGGDNELFLAKAFCV